MAFRLNRGNVKIDILDRMGYWVAQTGGKRIANENLVAPNDLRNKVLPS